MAQRNHVAIVVVRPVQGLFHLFAERNIIQHAVAAGDENAEVVAAIQILHHLRQLFRLLELATVLLVGGLDRFVFLRERPHLQLHRIAGRRGDVDLETGQIRWYIGNSISTGWLPVEKNLPFCISR